MEKVRMKIQAMKEAFTVGEKAVHLCLEKQQLQLEFRIIWQKTPKEITVFIS
jgi:hypothetical protein